MLERFDEPAGQVMDLACQEADRLRHDYVGPEHVLAGLARQDAGRAARVLRASGLSAEAVRAGLDRLVVEGVLPGPWRNHADLLRTLGIDLASVQQAVDTPSGSDAVREASRRALGRSRLREGRLRLRRPP